MKFTLTEAQKMLIEHIRKRSSDESFNRFVDDARKAVFSVVVTKGVAL